MEFFYDLHIHSCLSPCASDDMTPQNIANMAVLAGYDIIAVADHNSTLNCQGVMTAAEDAGILAVPAMELTTREEVHVLCLFQDLAAAKAFGDYVWARLPNIPNRRDIFGAQIHMDGWDNMISEVDKLLISAVDIGIYEVYDLIRGYGGTAIPAHADRGSFSVLSNLGFYDPAMRFPAVELTNTNDRERLARPELGLPEARFFNSDSHNLEDILDAKHTISLHTRSAQELIRAIEAGRQPE